MNALDIISIAILSAITEKKSTLPIILNAIPMAKTAIAIRSMVPTPFLRLPSVFLSPPAFSKKDESSALLRLDIDIMVFCCLRISCVSFLTDCIPTTILFMSLPKSPETNASEVADFLVFLPLLRTSAISSSAQERLVSASNKRLSIKQGIPFLLLNRKGNLPK